MRLNVLTVKTIDDLTLYFRAQSEEKDVNGLAEIDYVERIRAVTESENPQAAFEAEDLRGEMRSIPADEIAQFGVEALEETELSDDEVR